MMVLQSGCSLPPLASAIQSGSFPSSPVTECFPPLPFYFVLFNGHDGWFLQKARTMLSETPKSDLLGAPCVFTHFAAVLERFQNMHSVLLGQDAI